MFGAMGNGAATAGNGVTDGTTRTPAHSLEGGAPATPGAGRPTGKRIRLVAAAAALFALSLAAGWALRERAPSTAERDAGLALADLYARHGRAADAAAWTRAALDDPHATAYAQLRAAAALYHAADYAGAEKLYRALLASAGESPLTLYNLACARLRQGDRFSAAKLFERVSERYGDVLPGLAESARRLAADARGAGQNSG